MSHFYRLALPKGLKIYNVFALDILAKDLNDSLPSQENPKPSSEVIIGQEK